MAAPRAAPRGDADALQARCAAEAPPVAWAGGALRFALPRAAQPPALLLAAWRLGPRGAGPQALLALRGVPPPPPNTADDVACASSFALVPLLDALRDASGLEAPGSAMLARYQRAAAAIAPHSLADEVTAACAVPVHFASGAATSDDADSSSAAVSDDEPDDVALALRGGRVLRLRRGVVAAEGVCGFDDAPTSLHCVPVHPRGAALLAVAPDWRASAVALCARTLRGGAAASDVTAALPLLHGGAGTGVLCGAGAALLLPRGLDGDDDVAGAEATQLLRAAEGPAWSAALQGARILSLPAALAAAAPVQPPAAPGALAVAAALAARVAAARDTAADESQRLATQAQAAAAARALLARCAAAACGASPNADPGDVDAMMDCDDLACTRVSAALRGAFCDDEWRVAADVAVAGAPGCELRDVALALLPPAGGNERQIPAAPLRGRAGAAAQPLRAGGPSTTLAAAAPAAAVAAACGDGPALVVLTATLHRGSDSNPESDDAGVPFAAVLGALQPRWAAPCGADDVAEEAVQAGPPWGELLPGWRRDALLTSRAADLRTAPRALCAALRMAPDAAEDRSGCVVLRPAVNATGGGSALPAGCSVRLAPRGAQRAELTLTAARRCDGLRLARHVAAALPADVASAPNAAAPPALAAAAALAEALRAEIRARLAAAEGDATTHAAAPAAKLAADSAAAMAVLLLATAQD